MSDADSDIGALRAAAYTAYSEAVIIAFRTLSASITEYFEEHHELDASEPLEVPRNFRPLRDYERTLRVQQLTLRLALKTAELMERDMANGAEPPVPVNCPAANARPSLGMVS
jgi:hypothetical protein